jgi:hypothetical protein
MSDLTRADASRLLGAMLADYADLIPAVDLEGHRWFDTRPLIDPRERSEHELDIAREALDLGTSTGLLARHFEHPHLVRVTRRENAAPTLKH